MEGLIQEKEFLEAIEVVKKYKLQVEALANESLKVKSITIGGFLNTYKNIIISSDMRLYNSLKRAEYYHDEEIINITSRELLKVRHLGKRALSIFIKIAIENNIALNRFF